MGWRRSASAKAASVSSTGETSLLRTNGASSDMVIPNQSTLGMVLTSLFYLQ